MKKHIKSIVFIALLMVGIAAAVYAKAQATYTVQNDTNFNVGNVTLNLQNGNPVVVNVTGNGSFTVNLASSVTSVVINNTVAPIGSTTSIKTGNGDQVNCTPGASAPVCLIN